MNSFDARQLSLVMGPCPGCGSGQLKAVQPEGEPPFNFLCLDCRRCWHAELEWVALVDGATCAGCASRAVCQA